MTNTTDTQTSTAPNLTRRRFSFVPPLLAAVVAQLVFLRSLTTDPWRLGLRPVSELVSGAAVVFGPLLLLAVVIAWIVGVRERVFLRDTLRDLTPHFAILILLNALLTTALVRPLWVFPIHFGLTLLISVVSLVCLLAVLNRLPANLLERIDQWLATSKHFKWYAAIFCTIVAAILSTVVFNRIPHIPDEVVYLLQAKMLAVGKLSVPDLPGGDAWKFMYTLHEGGNWFGIFPPGWPAVLAIGVTLGAPWLVNPVLGGVVVILAHRLARTVAGLQVANCCALLLATSPWFLFLSASMMSHIASLLFATVVYIAALRLVSPDTAGRRGTAGAGIAGGVALGLLVLTRPIEGVVIGLIALIWLTVTAPRVLLSLPLALCAISAIAVGALLLPYDAALTGHALVDPITRYFDTTFYPGVNRLGFGATIGNVGWSNDYLPGHSPFEALLNANADSHLLQLELFGWMAGSSLVALGYVASGKWRKHRPLWLMLGVVLGIFVAYALYWYSGADFGARYWSQFLVPLALLTACGAVELGRSAASHGSVSSPRSPWLAAVVLFSLLGAPGVIAVRATRKYTNYRGMTTEVADLARRRGWGNDLILMRGPIFSDYASGMILNDPEPVHGRPVYTRYVTGSDLAQLRARFPDRRIIIVDGGSLTHGPPVLSATQIDGDANPHE